jgi:hypothetical protein
MILAPSSIYGFARGAGFNPAQAVVATAVALAESGGKTTAHCLDCFPGVKEDSRGLWQVNVDAHPDMASWNLYDPATNAKAAYQISSGGKSFGAWSTYTSGAYRSHLAAAGGAAGSPTLTGPVQKTGGDTSSAGGGVASTVGNVLSDPFGTLFGSLTSGVTKDVYRIAVSAVLVLGGAALVVVGLTRSVQSPVQKVANVGGNGGVVAKATKAAKVAAVA